MTEAPLPNALLFVATGCPHCGAVLEGLARQVKQGRLARLEVVNLSAEPEAAAKEGVRSVPWTRIGPFELVGALSAAEIADWVEYARNGEGWSAYYAYLLENRRLDEVVRRIRESPSTLACLLAALDDETPMALRIGISAVIEELSGSEALRGVLPQLEQLALADSPQTRADACHFLGLTGDRRAAATARRLLDDEQPHVREIARETLALLGETSSEES
jgi:HEAT repeat protein